MVTRSMERRGSTPPDRRTLNFGSLATLVPLVSVVSAGGTPRRSRRGDPVAETHIPEAWVSACAGTTAKVLVETAHHTPPGRSPELASEKCACTTPQPPASLRNTMVERVMDSSPP